MAAAAEQQPAAEQLTMEENRGSGVQRRAPEPRFLAVGLVVGVHGLRGELKVEVLTSDPHRIGRLERVFVGIEGQEPAAWSVEGYRLHKGYGLLKLGQCDNRNTAEALRGHLIQVPLDEAIPLDEGEYYEHQIVGLEVWTEAGEHLGEVAEILYTGANDVYVVRGPGPGRREILIPAIEGVVIEVNLGSRRLVVKLLEGL